MSTYTVERLLEDVVKKHGAGLKARVPPGTRPETFLKEVWATVDKYATACLEEKRGVALPNFCRIGWQATQRRQRTGCRPYFKLHDSFSRAYGVTTSRLTLQQPDAELLPVEELDLSKAAIRFSGSLTKDHVSAGLRCIVQQIGDALSQGRLLKLELSFGKLLAKEREVSLVFDPKFLVAQSAEPASDGAGADALEMRKGHRHSDPQKFVRLEIGDFSLKGCAAGGGASASTDAPSSQACEGDEAPLLSPPSQRDLCGRMPRPRFEAHEDILHLQIAALERRASEAVQKAAEVDSYAYHGRASDERAQEQRKAQHREIQESLRAQIAAKERRRQSEAQDTVSEVTAGPRPQLDYDLNTYRRDMLTSEDLAVEMAKRRSVERALPPVPAALVDLRGTARARQTNFRAQLDAQLQAKREQQEFMKQLEKHADANNLEAQLNQATIRRQHEEAQRVNEREVLNAAWSQEAKIKVIRQEIEAIEAGKRVPVTKTGRPPLGATPENWRGASERPSPRGSDAPTGLRVSPKSARAELRGGSSRRPLATPAAPLSARGEALRAVAALELNLPSVVVEAA
mmetsp:Transcript_88725/g.228858  ORF Transcript_88725/g.228858 Transcript_88725/m.228858 type:complete len:572 (-) Transcript_88725:102-1817(-)